MAPETIYDKARTFAVQYYYEYTTAKLRDCVLASIIVAECQRSFACSRDEAVEIACEAMSQIRQHTSFEEFENKLFDEDDEENEIQGHIA
jgi:hypothetical protein